MTQVPSAHIGPYHELTGVLAPTLLTRWLQVAGMLADDGRCKVLDAAADGYVRAEGMGVMLLQRVLGNSNCHGAIAYITGSAVNQDGR